ncbi:MAG: hypothetical protein ABMA15_19665 [Vicinamibacterales bacterium]
MFDLSVASAHHVRHYCVTLAGDSGWEVTIEEDRAVQFRETLEDWHHVERSVARMRREVSELLDRGWQIQPFNQ